MVLNVEGREGGKGQHREGIAAVCAHIPQRQHAL